jgi:hypothetical protein
MLDQSREAELSAQRQAQEEKMRRLEAENKLLREKIDPQQLLLMLQGLDAPPKSEEPVEAEVPPRRRRGIERLVGGRAALDGPILSA